MIPKELYRLNGAVNKTEGLYFHYAIHILPPMPYSFLVTLSDTTAVLKAGFVNILGDPAL